MIGLGMGSGLVGLLLMALLWGGLIALATRLVQSLFPQGEKLAGQLSFQGLSAREILDRRYVRGEISRSEYDLMKDTLSRY